LPLNKDLSFVWAIAMVASAEEAPTFINKHQEDEIIHLVYTQMIASLEELEIKIGKCEILEKNNTLAPALFQSLPLTKQEARTALGYFSLYAYECESGNGVTLIFSFTDT